MLQIENFSGNQILKIISLSFQMIREIYRGFIQPVKQEVFTGTVPVLQIILCN
jgi:hypothetical protein